MKLRRREFLRGGAGVALLAVAPKGDLLRRIGSIQTREERELAVLAEQMAVVALAASQMAYATEAMSLLWGNVFIQLPKHFDGEAVIYVGRRGPLQYE